MEYASYVIEMERFGLVMKYGYDILQFVLQLIKEWKSCVITCSMATIIAVYLLRRKRKNHSNVFKVVLTGGPCAGKTSALSRVGSALSEAGIHSLFVPEAATIIFSNGGIFPGLNAEHSRLLRFEEALINLQLSLEKTFRILAENSNHPTVLLLDRGIGDISAYMPKPLWAELLNIIHETNPSILKRYDVVCHLVTSADGAPEHYTSANGHRTESAAEAIMMDKRCSDGWKEHTNLHIIDNSTDFDEKMRRTTELIVSSAKKHFKMT